MEHTTAPETRTAQPASATVGQRPIGQLLVGDYVGTLAAEATQALRRAGLRPGLDRCHGYEAAHVGYVIAQQPAAGSQVARNSVITLHVGTPPTDIAGQERTETPPAERDPGEDPTNTGSAGATHTAPGSATFIAEDPDISSHAPLSRKPRPHTDGPPAFEHGDRVAVRPADTTTMAPHDLSPRSEGSHTDGASAAGYEGELAALAQQPTDRLAQGRLVTQTDELFARRHDARAGTWRATHTRPVQLQSGYLLRRAGVWLHGRSRPTKVLLALFAVWACAWLASVLSAHSTDQASLKVVPRPSVSAPVHTRPAKTPTAPATAGTHIPLKPAHRHTAHRTSAPQPQRTASATGTDDQTSPVQVHSTPPVQASSATGTPPPAAQPSAPPQQQTQGGPFSP